MERSIGGLRNIAFNVLGQVGYGQPKRWSALEPKPEIPGRLGYFEAIQSIVNNLVLAYFLPTWLLQLPFWPQSVKTIALAVKELPNYTKVMLQKEREILASSNDSRDNLMSMLVRLSDQEKINEKGQTAGKSAQFLSEREISGNLYLFTIAGFDTTSNTLAYAFTTLAIYPEWQKWIIEELDEVLTGNELEGFDYNANFPRLTRCLALMVRVK